MSPNITPPRAEDQRLPLFGNRCSNEEVIMKALQRRESAQQLTRQRAQSRGEVKVQRALGCSDGTAMWGWDGKGNYVLRYEL